MFVNCSQNGQLAWTVPKSMHISKIHSLSMGGARSRLLVHIASPTSPPYVGTQLTALFRTQLLLKCLVYSIAAPNGKLRILVKAPDLHSKHLATITRLGIRPRDLALSNEYTLGHCGLSAASRHKLASTSRHHSLLTCSYTT